jgi:N-methylhydantoinase A
VHAGVLSAVGMLAAPRGRQLSHTLCAPVSQLSDVDIEQHFQAMVEQGSAELQAEGVPADIIRSAFSLDLRYLGQSFTLNVPFDRLGAATQAFNTAHSRRFGHTLDVPVEVVNLRVGLSAEAGQLQPGPRIGDQSGKPLEHASVYAIAEPVPVRLREQLDVGKVHTGPMLVIDRVATTFVAEGWCATLHASGCLLLQRVDA